METKEKQLLQLDSIYTNTELTEIGLAPIRCNRGFDYLIYEKESALYFFEKLNNNLLRLYCKTSKQSFYL